ncbi:MAG: hypothetical protein ACOCYU_02280 [Brevefilum sp.]
MEKLSNRMHQLSTGWAALTALLLFLLFSALILPAQAERAETYSGDVGSPDSSFFYTADKLYQFAESYGPQGRQAYIRARWTFDLIWPLVYTAFLGTAISWLIKQTSQKESRLRFINLIPVLSMLLDFIENSGASIVMARYPQQTPVLAHLTGFFTALKWLSIGGSFVALAFVLLLAIWKLIKSLQ